MTEENHTIKVQLSPGEGYARDTIHTPGPWWIKIRPTSDSLKRNPEYDIVGTNFVDGDSNIAVSKWTGPEIMYYGPRTGSEIMYYGPRTDSKATVDNQYDLWDICRVASVVEYGDHEVIINFLKNKIWVTGSSNPVKVVQMAFDCMHLCPYNPLDL